MDYGLNSTIPSLIISLHKTMGSNVLLCNFTHCDHYHARLVYSWQKLFIHSSSLHSSALVDRGPQNGYGWIVELTKPKSIHLGEM